jgi:hypothetical protein
MIYILKEGEASESTGLSLTPEKGLLTSPQPVSDKTEETDTTKAKFIGNNWLGDFAIDIEAAVLA